MNYELNVTSLRACEAIQNLIGAPGLLRRLAMTGRTENWIASQARNDGD